MHHTRRTVRLILSLSVDGAQPISGRLVRRVAVNIGRALVEGVEYVAPPGSKVRVQVCEESGQVVFDSELSGRGSTPPRPRSPAD